MKRLRHRLGRWLLRDAVEPAQTVRIRIDGNDLIAAMRKRGGGPGLGLS